LGDVGRLLGVSREAMEDAAHRPGILGIKDPETIFKGVPTMNDKRLSGGAGEANKVAQTGLLDLPR
jgi:hypothetical protein